MVPTDIKNSAKLNIFKDKIRNWEPKKCNCKLCLSNIQNIGYIKMLSEFNFSCFETPNPLSMNVLARFHAFCISCDSVEMKLASTAVG